MKKKSNLNKVTLAASVVGMGIGLFQSFDVEAQSSACGCNIGTAYSDGDDKTNDILQESFYTLMKESS